jgi:cell division protein FtsI/penicillin-binding protein 2
VSLLTTGVRRTAPLLVLWGLALMVLLGRLYQIQVLEHEVWAEQARRLEKKGQVLPYERGKILYSKDSKTQVVLAQDALGYQVSLDYRDFRRLHPLGIVTHARSVLERRPVPLAAGRDRLILWAGELVRLTPGALYGFARGGPLQTATLELSTTDEASADQRGSRAADLRYYAKALLELSKSERSRLIKLERSATEQRSYLELVAGWRGLSPEELSARCAARWSAHLTWLEDLARNLDWEEDEDALWIAPIERLLGALEAWRESVENAAAGRLFRDVSGFSAGRLAPRLLLDHLELSWLQRVMHWDAARLAQWAADERAAFVSGWRDGWALPRLLAQLQLDDLEDRRPDRALDYLVTLYVRGAEMSDALEGRPRRWNELREVSVLDDLTESLLWEAPAGFDPDAGPPLPVWDAEVRAQAPADWQLLVELTPFDARQALVFNYSDPKSGWSPNAWVDPERYNRSLARAWSLDSAGTGVLARERTHALARGLLDAFERHFQACAEVCLEAARDTLPDPADKLRFSPERLDRITERARHLLKDYGSRPVALHERPDYDEVVYLVAREPERFPGLAIETLRDRQRGTGFGALAENLVGEVGQLDASALQRQRDETQELDTLRKLTQRTPEQEERLRVLMQGILRVDELRGVRGVEAMLDDRLSGSNGYKETLGLQDAFGEGRQENFEEEVRHGEDVTLTLHPRLQWAAEEVINFPLTPDGRPFGPDGAYRAPTDKDLSRIDRDWFDAPVGAIVLLSREGDVLAAASAPNDLALVDDRGQLDLGQRGQVIDRALRRPTFQPIGSVFKPFVAVHALDRFDGVGVGTVYQCEVPPGMWPWAEFGGVRCHQQGGHRSLDLERAIAVSCNSYFARLGDGFDLEELHGLTGAFGFGQRTGVRPAGFRGLIESNGHTPDGWLVFARDADFGRQMRRATNGLQVIEGTPMQVARAYLGLALGKLPALRLVESVGKQPFPRSPARPLPYSERSLQAVRDLLRGVTATRDGSGYHALNVNEVGFPLAIKTGSADLQARNAGSDGEKRKHTWVAGWLPPEDPQLAFCVFLHSTSTTSGHSAVWVARQLLLREEIRGWLSMRGVTSTSGFELPSDAFIDARAVWEERTGWEAGE